MRNLNLSKAVHSQAERNKELSFSVQKTHVIDDSTSRMLIAIPESFQKRISEEAMAATVEKAFTGVRYMNNSLTRASEDDRTLFSCFVTKKRLTMPLEQASAANFDRISDTVFQDDDDNIWTVNGSGESAYLVAQSSEDIGSLIGAVRTRAIATASIGIDLEVDYAKNNLVRFYDVKTETAGYGMAVSGRQVYDFEKETLVEVSGEMTTFVYDGYIPVPVDNKEVAAVGDGNKKAFIEYMKALYGHNTAFFNEIKSMINQAVVA